MSAVPPNALSADRNLLFGMLALQMDFVTRDALIAAMHAWVLDKSKSLGELLESQRALTAQHHALLAALVEAHLARHNDDPEQSLAAITSTGLARQQLEQLSQGELAETFSHILGNTPAHAESSTLAYQPERLDDTRFAILRAYAKGGLGEVFVARDMELNREIALKEIQPRHAHDLVSRARFVQEAEITGGLEHPGIVPVYGFGKYADGRPYYAMRLIHGESLKVAIRHFHSAASQTQSEHSLRLRQLLNAFLTVCQALQYAHSRGIVHRDIKPDNILLGKYGETLLVDWGLAKPVKQSASSPPSLESAPLHPSSSSDIAETQAGTALGTPAYMSPEQAAGRGEVVGVTSDVYSLGATLYCLLTGQGPFPGENLAEVMNMVQRGDFLSPRKVAPEVPPPLEAICLKAMALEPAQRFHSARELAEEIEHWLADEPVRTYSDPLSVRVGRWTRRHQAIASGAAALLVTAVIGLTLTTVLVRQQQQATSAQKLQTEKNLAMAKRAVEDYLVKVTDNPRLAESDFHELRRELLEIAIPYYEEFARQAGGDVSVQAEQGRAFERLGKLHHLLGVNDKALADFGAMQAIFDALTEGHPEQQENLADLARSHNGRGEVFLALGRRSEAEAEHRTSLAMLETLARNYPADTSYHRDLAASHFMLVAVLYDILARQGRLSDAQKECRQALAIQEQLVKEQPQVVEFRRDLAESRQRLGVLLHHGGKWTEADQETRQAMLLFQKLTEDFPKVADYSYRLDMSPHALGAILEDLKRHEEADKHNVEAVRLLEKLTRDFPSVINYREQMVTVYANQAISQMASGRLAGALQSVRSAQVVADQLLAEHPNIPRYRETSAYVATVEPSILAKQGDYLAAAAAARKIGERPALDDLTRFNLACAWSLTCQAAALDQQLTPAERQLLVDEYATLALQWLAKVRDNGMFAAKGAFDALNSDDDFSVLRTRSDFQRFVEEVAKALPKDGTPPQSKR